MGGDLHKVKVGTAPQHPCGKDEQQITWSETGPAGADGTNGTNGADGTSVTSAPEPAGANCANGGSSFTSASGTTYACNGAKGDKGDPGPPGPTNLGALQGSPCTVSGHSSTLTVSTDNTTGAVSLTCQPLYTVSGTVTGGSMTQIQVESLNGDGSFSRCYSATSCSVLVSSGSPVRVIFTSGDEETGGGSQFTFTCPANSIYLGGTAYLQNALTSGSYASGTCEVYPGGITSDFHAAANFSS
jgi:hypothetical protein